MSNNQIKLWPLAWLSHSGIPMHVFHMREPCCSSWVPVISLITQALVKVYTTSTVEPRHPNQHACTTELTSLKLENWIENLQTKVCAPHLYGLFWAWVHSGSPPVWSSLPGLMLKLAERCTALLESCLIWLWGSVSRALLQYCRGGAFMPQHL